jgi:hypothetical protein
VERAGVHGVGLVVERDLDWVFREQPVEDYGIDAHVEVVDEDDAVTGQLIAVQVRSRERPFDRITGGWLVRDSLEHLDYWLGHVLPVILVVYDVAAERAYWQRVARHTVIRTGSGFKIEVPETQPLDATALVILREVASRDDDRAIERFDAMCGYLPIPCAETLVKAHESDPVASSRLAALLAEGRAQPSLTAQSILAAPPRGMTGDSWRLWQALGSYAAEHEVGSAVSAEAFERAAAAADADARPRLLGLAACLLAEAAVATGNDRDVTEAHRAAAEARAADPANLLADLAEAVARAAEGKEDRPWVPRPWRLPDSIQSLTDDYLGRDAMLGIAVGDEALIRRDVETALSRYKAAVAAMPGAPGPKMKLAHALVRRAAEGSALAAVDYEDAERLAREALSEQRRWAGPSEQALELLLHILLARSAFTDAVHSARLDPLGTALPREADHEGVRFLGARAALALGMFDVADELAAGLRDPLKIAQFAAWHSDHGSGAPGGSHREWELVADLATTSRDLTALTVASHKLAARGTWPVPGLVEAASAGAVPPTLMTVLAAVADAANGEVDRAVAALRALEATEILAVEHQAQILSDAGRVEEAVRISVRGAERFQAPHLRYLASELLARAGRADESAAILVQLLASGAVTSSDARRSIRLKLIEHGHAAGAWADVEDHALAELGSVEREDAPPVGRPADWTDQFAWALVTARINRRELEMARAAWERYKPAIASPRQAQAWLMLQRRGFWRPEAVDLGLAIAEQWPDQEQLVSHVITTLLFETAGDDEEARLTLTEAHGGRLASVQARYHADYPDGALQMVQFDVAQFVEDVSARLQSVARLSADLEAMVRQHRLPVGVLATASRRPYALAVLTRAAGVTPAGTPYEIDYDVELAAAARAMEGGSAVCEASALYLGVLLDEHWPAIRGAFHRLLLPLVSYDDILRTVDDLVVPAAGTLQYDAAAGKLVVHTPTPEVTSMLRERAAALEAKARGLDREPVGDLTVVPGQDRARDGAWLAPLQLAADTGTPLFSDDVALRQLARSVGVDAFGTLALLHAMIDRGDLDDVSEAVMRLLVSEFVVDVPVPLDVLSDIAEADAWASGPAMTVVTRPRWWADIHEAAQDFLQIARGAVGAAGGVLRQWVYAAALGAAADKPQEAQPDAIALVASLVIARITGVAGDSFADIVNGAREAAGSLGCEDPTDRMIAALCAVMADLSGTSPEDQTVRAELTVAFTEAIAQPSTREE